jgi:hypothetical protein
MNKEFIVFSMCWLIIICFVLFIVYTLYHIVKHFIMSLLNKEVKVIYYPAPSNYEGVPPEGITWDEAWKYVKPSIPCGVVAGRNSITFSKQLDLCPKCNKKLKKYQSDLQVIELDDKQYMVTGEYCPDGHYTHLDCA